ncbi:hypothetical protein AG1IA_09902 [Rhizoctonia solani AG-1 IA]|uniref:Uncharacterized protein n=1 Tax=Thanatephorus cucumeris (strain AG1-IA) TaxID=983506 RepID=L8WH10_THACA|nr:hypothetical protein AG1IA_09902 [Rhizoctonia solani AG-1 IA]
MFSRMTHEDKLAFFELLDEYFESRPNLFSRESADPGLASQPAAVAANAVHRTMAANPQATADLISTGLKNIPKGSQYGAVRILQYKKAHFLLLTKSRRPVIPLSQMQLVDSPPVVLHLPMEEQSRLLRHPGGTLVQLMIPLPQAEHRRLALLAQSVSEILIHLQ